MSDKKILGHIDCPACGTAGGMRVTHDKNGEPFGFCEAECNLQIRFGGNPRRVAHFVSRYPWAGRPGAEPDKMPAPEPKPEPEKKPVTVTAEKPPFGLPAPKPAAKPAPVKSGFDYGL